MLGELVEWVLNLDREFAFLLALPFAVALAGYIAHALTEGRRDRVEKQKKPAAQRVTPTGRSDEADLAH